MNGQQPEDGSWIDEVADRFEADWGSGTTSPRIEDFLAGVAEPRRSRLREELLRVELVVRRGRGETPAPEEYLVRFPELTEVMPCT